MHAYMHTHACHGVHMDVRGGQLAKVSFNFSYVGSGDQIEVVWLIVKSLC